MDTQRLLQKCVAPNFHVKLPQTTDFFFYDLSQTIALNIKGFVQCTHLFEWKVSVLV